MIKIFLKTFIFICVFALGMNISYAAKGTGAATIYKISVTKLELCETGSTLSNCLNPITVSNPGLTTDVDLASITAGEAACYTRKFWISYSRNHLHVFTSNNEQGNNSQGLC
jgi:hypothetical protein